MEESRRGMERKSGSSSRSPSLSRRPSLKDKKGTTITKGKGKKGAGSGSKKERWLLTRKTWRYMSDAVGNLLPESHRSGGGSGSGSGGTTRRPSSTGGETSLSGTLLAGPSSGVLAAAAGVVYPPPPQYLQHVQHHHHHHYSSIPGGPQPPSTSALAAAVTSASAATRPKSMPSVFPAAGPTSSGGGSGPGSKASSGVTSPTYGGVMSFPSHRPGVQPTGPGPGKLFSQPSSSSQHAQQVQVIDKFYPPSDDIPTLEKHFDAVCNKEKRFLLWNRTKAKGLSGPALREKKEKKQQQGKAGGGHRNSSGSIMEALQSRLQLGGGSRSGGGGGGECSKENVLSGDYYSPAEEDDDDYDEYDDLDEEQITVRERRKSSTASSTMSMLIGGGGGPIGHGWTQGSLTFLRPMSTLSSHGSESSYAMILTPTGVTKICRNTGTQTDPFPEELLIRFRLQDVQEERQSSCLEWRADRQLSPDNQSDIMSTTGGGGGAAGLVGSGGGMMMIGSGDMDSPLSPPGRSFSTQKVSSPPPTMTATGTTASSPMSPTTSVEAGRASSGSGRESQEKVLESCELHSSSTRPSISGQESIATTATTKSGTDLTSSSGTSGGTDKKSEESGYSSSIQDTVMRYLRMVRKNSKADNKDTIDKFKTVNYDRSLRYIKSKNVTVEEALEHERNKAAQQQQKDAAAQSPAATGSVASGATAAALATSAPTSQGSEVAESGTDVAEGPPFSSPSESEGIATQSFVPLNTPPGGIPAMAGGLVLGGPTVIEGGGTSFPLEGEALKLGPKVEAVVGAIPLSHEILPGGVAVEVKGGNKMAVVTEGGGSGPPQVATVGILPQLQRPLQEQQQQTGSLNQEPTDIPSSPGGPASTSSQPASPKELDTLSPQQFSPAAQPPPTTEVSSFSVGIQAGESLVRFLRNLNPSARKMSDFSSSCCSSESPAEVFSPRYSFATTVMSSSDNEMYGGGGGIQQAAVASMMAMAAAKGIPHPHYHQHRQHHPLPHEGGEEGGGAFEDVIQGHHHHHLQLQQQRRASSYFQKQTPQQSSGGGEGGGGPLSSSWTSSATRSSISTSTTTTTIKKSSSVQQMVSFERDVAGGGSSLTQQQASTPVPSSSYSLSQFFHYSPSKSLRSSMQQQQQHHHHHHHGSGSPGTTTTSTPVTPTTSSSIGGSSGGLMKSFFGSSPFSSTFGLGMKGKGGRKPTSTTSLTITTNTGSDSLSGGRGGGNAPPPTTSSSPNLLSLIQSSAASAGSGFSNLFSSYRGGGGTGVAASSSRSGEQCSYSQPRVTSSTTNSSGEPIRAQQAGSSSSPSSLIPSTWSAELDVEGGGAPFLPSSPQSSAATLFRVTTKQKKTLAHDMLAKYGSSAPTGGLHRHGSGSSVLLTKGISDLPAHPPSSLKGSTSMGAQTDLYLTPTATTGVMQKSKSSSSVLPLYGSSGSVSAAAAAGPATSSTAHLRASPSGSVGGAGDLPLNEPCPGASFGAGAVPSTTSAAAAVAASSSSTSSRLISKSKLFKSRSKSSTRATTSSSGSAICTWSPQGRCKWKSVSGKLVTLEPTTVLTLSDVERQTLQDVALEKLRSLNLGVDVKIPKEKVGGGQQKPKRRPYLLKKKALSTGFFESGSKREDGKDAGGAGGGSGLVFGISLSQCVTNDRLRQMKTSVVAALTPLASEWEQSHKQSQNGSRNSVSSAFEVPKGDKDPLQPPPLSVPVIVKACISHLESYGLHTTGIFRVSTSLKRIRQLREEIDSGKEVQFGEDHSPHDVAALLKEFLRDLPEPLLCRDLYQAFLKTQKIRNRKLQLEAIQHLVQLLPVSNRDTLAALLKFFSKVVENASETRSKSGELLPGNKMEGYSLATLIAPNILPCMPTEGAVAASMDQNAALTKERRESIDLVNYMISNYSAIFDVTAELLHDVYLHLMDTNPEAIEGILRQKCGVSDDGIDELETTSSVFEESESGEVLLEPEDSHMTTATRVFRRREDILHEGAGKGGQPEHFRGGGLGGTEERPRERTRMRGGDDGSGKERGATSGGAARGSPADAEKQQSGGESDSSSTRSTSRWFRRSRGDAKGRTSSDSGSEKVKGSRKRDSFLFESKRASSLDSVNVQEPLAAAVGAISGATVRVSSVSPRPTSGGDMMLPSRPLSGSEQSLRVPEHFNRRQSSPVLESSGIITASLKIPVPVPLTIDDTDIPFIEDENLVEGVTPLQHHHHHLQQHHHHHHLYQYLPSKYSQQGHQQPQVSPHQHQYHHVVHHQDPGVGVTTTTSTADPSPLQRTSSSANVTVVRCRSMSTDSSMPLKTTSSSANTTPISSPARQPSSEVSSPTGFSPPISPTLYGTFPVEEMTARMFIGSAAGSSTSTIPVPSHTSLSTSPSVYQFPQPSSHGSGGGTGPTLGAVTTTPSSAYHYPTMSKEVVESKSAGSTPVTRPKLEKSSTSTAVATGSPSLTKSRLPTISSASTISGGSPKTVSSGSSSTTVAALGQGAIASLGVIPPHKMGEIGTKSAPPSPQPPSHSLLSASSSSQVTTSVSSSSPSSSIASSSGVGQIATGVISPSTAMTVGEPKGLGKETKGANISGLIKSKTADFEKISKTSPTTATDADVASSSSGGGLPTSPSSSSSSASPFYSIAPKMRLRSQENVLLKQQFLLRQQAADRKEGASKGQKQESSLQEPSSSEDVVSSQSQSSTTSTPTSGRSITRRRLVGSASSSAIMSTPSPSSPTATSSPSQRLRTPKEPEAATSSGGGLEVKKESGSGGGGGPPSPGPMSGSSPTRWKRSEIIASRQQSQSSSTDPETFV